MAKRGRKSGKKANGQSANGAPAATERVNKSEMIRTIANDEGVTSPTQIRNLLAERGVEVSVPFVSTILSKARSKNGNGAKRSAGRTGGKANRGPGRKPAAAKSSGQSTIEAIQAAIELCRVAGGARDARAAIDLVEQIAQSVR